MFGWSSLGNGTKATAGIIAGVVLIILALLFMNRGDPAELATGADPQAVAGLSDGGAAEPDQAAAEGDETAAGTAGDDASDGTQAQDEAPEDSTPASEEGVAESSEAVSEDAPEATEAAAPESGNAQPEPPVFDVVRVEADGTALIAGRGVPGAIVTLLLDGQELIRETVDAAGAFVAFATVPESEHPQALSIRMSTSDNNTVESEQTVVIAPAKRTGPVQIADAGPDPEQPVVNENTGAATDGTALPETTQQVAELSLPAPSGTPDAANAAAQDVSPQPGAVESIDANSAPEADTTPAIEPAPEATELAGQAAAMDAPATEVEPDVAATEPAGAEPPAQSDDAAPDSDAANAEAPSVLIADADGVRVLQDGGKGPEVLDSIALDTISYDEAGEVTISGRSTGPGFVRVYIDNKEVKTLEIDPNGQWRAPLPEVDTGVYTLRIDELDIKGGVVSRVETPFKREEPEVLAAVLEEQGGSGNAVRVLTVQAGDTLWGISRENYGQGVLYVRVFEANRDRIRDPHWIYPGQVFTLPTGE